MIWLIWVAHIYVSSKQGIFFGGICLPLIPSTGHPHQGRLRLEVPARWGLVVLSWFLTPIHFSDLPTNPTVNIVKQKLAQQTLLSIYWEVPRLHSRTLNVGFQSTPIDHPFYHDFLYEPSIFWGTPIYGNQLWPN